MLRTVIVPLLLPLALAPAFGAVLARDGRAQDEARRHWAFQPLRRPSLPEITDSDWPRGPIDLFVLRAMRRHGLRPSPEADRATLARRVSLVLTGLPPSPEEVEAFERDPRTDAYERLVDRLLASPHHAEHLARRWMDLARYADTNGYHIDNHRDMWRWRDWVIDAFRRNMPFDEFTVRQLAGDLLENATPEDMLATGFNRNHMIMFEGGADPREFAVRYVADRTDTTATVWMGLTMACARCHDHKYDPITQRDYYRLYAFFANVPERGLDGEDGNAPPVLPLPDERQRRQLMELLAMEAAAQDEITRLEPELDRKQRLWERELAQRSVEEPRQGLVLHLPFDATGDNVPAGSVRSGRDGEALWLDGRSGAPSCGDVAGFDVDQPFTIACWVRPRGEGGPVLGKCDELAGYRGYDLGVVAGVWLRLTTRWADNDARFRRAIKVVTRQPLARDRWYHIAAVYDGSGRAAGVRIYVNGVLQALTVDRDDVGATIRSSAPLQIGARGDGRVFEGGIDDVRVYDRALRAEEIERLVLLPAWRAARIPPSRRDDSRRSTLREHFRELVSRDLQAIRERLQRAREARAEALKNIPTVMVMVERPDPRPVHVLVRGDYRRPGERVEPGVPDFLPPLPPGRRDRLALARWLVDPRHPLTARVTVNRFWQWTFGEGLVRTPGDFGTRGARPTHPELLDWLAVEFVESGWDVRGLLRRLVTSATFRQSSAVRSGDLERDPRDSWLARMPRVRLDAETIRDVALAASGLLDRRIGGPSVRPYQPPGLWKAVSFGGGYTSQVYEPSPVEDRYRRGLYVYWKRSSPYASFAVFDAPTREVCTVSRPRTTTPLQALVLLNDPVYVEAARGLGLRMLRSANEDAERLVYGWRACVARAPSRTELEILSELLEDERARLRADPAAAAALLAVGDRPARPPDVAPWELGAWTVVGSTLLNLSETITRP